MTPRVHVLFWCWHHVCPLVVIYSESSGVTLGLMEESFRREQRGWAFTWPLPKVHFNSSFLPGALPGGWVVITG